MVAISTLLNFALPPLSLLLLAILMLPSLIFKLLMHVRKSLRKENVANKVVLITGAASGIGEQMAYEYARRGAKLSLVDIRKEKLVAVSDKARSLGSPDVTTIAADVSKVQDCKRFVDETFNYFRRLDHLVNNAGISGKPVTVENMRDISEYTAVMDVNFWGAVNATLFAIPHLKNSKGRIIVIASVCGWFPLPLISIYNASKGAITNFFETLRMEAGNAIGITIATPGFIKTDLTLKAKFELKDVMRIIPMASASECAKAIVESACRGDMYVTHPSWYKALFPWKVQHPQFVDWAVKLICAPSLNKSAMKDNLMMPEYKDINFWGSAYSTYFSIPHLRQSKGKIVAVASYTGWMPVPTMSIYNASKAAVISLYQTLRTELGRDVGITIVTPVLIESEMSQGKILSKDGKMVFDQQIRDMEVGVVPINSVTEAAKAIVNSVCRGDSYLTEPAWFTTTFYWQIFFPEVLGFLNRRSLTSESAEEDPASSKKVLDIKLLKKYINPKSVRSPNIKPN